MLDISSAFPSVYHNVILDRLLQLNCPDCYIRWIASYLDQRKVYVDTQDGPVYVNTPNGTPQGAVISSLLFLVVIDDLIRKLNRHDQKTTAFADDLGILVTGPNRKEIEDKMNAILEDIRKWGIATKTSFNTKKTKAMIFSHLRRLRPIRLLLGSEQIEMVNQYKYLGITLDSKLSFQAHISNVTKTATNTITRIMAIAKLNWGLNPNSAKQIYQMAILPMLLYGSPIWGRAIKKKTVIKQLRRVQRLAAIYITGALRTSSTEGLLVVAGLEPIENVITRRGANFHIKTHLRENIREELHLDQLLATHDSLPTHDTVLQWSDLAARQSDWKPGKGEPIEDLSLHFNPADNMIVNVQIESKEEADRTARIHSKKFSNKTVLFTDASKTGRETNTGIAVVIRTNDLFTTLVSKSLPPETSVYRGELEAVASALETMEARSKEEVWVFSDSESSLNAIANWKQSRSHVILRIIKQLRALSNEGKTVYLRWCPSHCGIAGNEATDQADKEAAYTNQFDHSGSQPVGRYPTWGNLG